MTEGPNGMRVAHDGWTCLIANAVGCRRNIAVPLVNYRRHASAITLGTEVRTGIIGKSTQSARSGFENYARMARNAMRLSKHLNAISDQSPQRYASDLRVAADAIALYADLWERRAHLRSKSAPLSISGCLLKMVLEGSYFGRGTNGFNIRAFTSDAAYTLAALGRNSCRADSGSSI